MMCFRLSSGRWCRWCCRVLLVSSVFGGFAGCGRSPAKPASSTAAVAYRVRGIVRGITKSPASQRSLILEHEAIAGFRDRQGKVVGMPSMSMAFGVVPSIDLDRLQPGDKVGVEFEVRWQAAEPLRIIRLERLKADVVLVLAAPAQGASESGQHSPHDHSAHPH